MTTIQLTETQRAVLAYATAHTGGRIDWFPEAVKGGARKRVLDALVKRGLISDADGDCRVTDSGYMALGLQRPTPQATRAVAPLRAGTKQATVLAMLQRPEGATVAQIMQVTGWQAHTVRGALAGTFKKKLALTIVSTKSEAGERVYTMAASAATSVGV